MNEVLTVLAWAAALLLVTAGLAKVRQPSATSATLRAASLPSHPATVRSLGLVECVLGVALLALGGRAPAVLLAASYLGFALFAARHRQRPGSSCGCFGESSAPLGRRHVVVDGAVAVALVGAAAASVEPLTSLASGVHAVPAVLAGLAVATVVALLRTHLTDAVALDAALAETRGGTP